MDSIRELTTADAPALTALYEEYAWWDDRSVADVRTALAESDVAIGVVDDGDLIAAARVLTDFTYYGYIFDVIVATDRQDEGIGRQLMAGVRDHSHLEDVTLSLLCRRGLVPFYESVGFARLDQPIDIPNGDAEELVIMYEDD